MVIGTLMALPVLTLLFTTSHEANVSEDYMFAESLAQRHLAEYLARPFDELDELCPLEVPITGVPEEDEVLGRYRSEYAKNLNGSTAFTGRLEIRRLQKGLLKYEISFTWPVRPGVATLRRYALIRLRSRHDIAISTNYPLTVVERERAEGES